MSLLLQGSCDRSPLKVSYNPNSDNSVSGLPVLSVLAFSLILVHRFPTFEDLVQRCVLTYTLKINIQDKCLGFLLDFFH